MTLRLILTPDDQPMSEAVARAQIGAEWVKAQHELASIITALPNVAVALIDGADMALTLDDLRRLADEARQLANFAWMLSAALENAANIAAHVRIEAGQ